MSKEYEKAAEKLWNVLERDRAQIGEEYTGEDVDCEAVMC
jgi:hypothetical protein